MASLEGRSLRIALAALSLFALLALCGPAPAAPPGRLSERRGVSSGEAERLLATADAALYLEDESRLLLFEEGGTLPLEAAVETLRRQRRGLHLLKVPAEARGPLPRRQTLAMPLVTLTESFENGLSAWSLDDDTLGLYSWGATRCEARTGSFSADAVRGGANPLSCSDPYGPNATQVMHRAACEAISGASQAWLDVYVHLATETDADTLGFFYEGADQRYHGYVFSGSTSGWFHLVINLKQWYGVGDVTQRPCPRLLVEFSSDVSIEPGFGARLDDLSVRTNPPEFLTAAIQAAPVSGPAPLDVSFTAVVSGASASATRLWSFGDAAASTATGATASFRYTAAGDYQARLRVDDSGQRAYAHQTIQVTETNPCALTCSASATASAQVDTPVTFSASATANGCASAVAYGWSFGDGATASGPQASHAYRAAGAYTWTLTATADAQTCTRTGTITVDAPPSGPSLSLGAGTGPSGGTATVPLRFTAGSTPLTALSFDLAAGSLTLVGASPSPAAAAAGKGLARASGDSGARVVVWGKNASALPAGDLGTLTFAIASGTAPGTLAVAPTRVQATTAAGTRVIPSSTAGSVAVSGTAAPATALFVPVVLSLAGAAGSYYTSELTLTNRGADDALLDVAYTASQGGGSGHFDERLPAGRQRVLADVVEWLRASGLSLAATGSRLGTLRITSAAAGLSALCRTSTRVPEGRAGLAYPAVAQGLTGPALLFGLRRDAQDRANVAFANAGGPTDGEVRLRVTVRSGAPAAPGSGTFDLEPLAPGAFLQLTLDDAVARAGLSLAAPNVHLRVERAGGTAPYYTYGVVNDNGTSDGSFLFPVPEAAASGPLTVPVVVETSAFDSELVLTNTSSSTRALTLTFVAGAVTSAGNAAATTLTLAPYEQRLLPGFVEWLRGRGVAGVGLRGPTFAGALFVGGETAGVLAGARTASAGGAGRYGLFYAATPAGGGASAAWLFGLRQDAENRTNLAFANTGERDGAPVTLRVELFSGETGELAGTATATLEARRFTQLDRVLQQYAAGLSHGYARVTRVAGQNPFITYAVVNDGGAPGERSGDGAYVPMEVEP